MPETFTSAANGPEDDAPFRSRLSFDLDVDICVVGAGLAGLTVALEAARLGASVAVLEGRHVGWNASGHQLGTVMPGYSLPIGDLIERVGLDDARELWAMSKEGADYVRAAATEEAMPGIALTEGALEVSNVDAGETLISRLQTLSEDFETEVEGWQVDRVRDQLGTARYFHGVYYPRARTVGGCTAHYAMIIIRPHDSDWETIRDATGDDSWAPREMDKYFGRVERWRHRSASAASHGKEGWLPTRFADVLALGRDSIHHFDSAAPASAEVISALVKNAFGVGAVSSQPKASDLSDVVENELADRLMILAADDSATAEVRSQAWVGVNGIYAQVKTSRRPAASNIARQIEAFIRDPKQNVPKLRPSTAPPGPPI